MKERRWGEKLSKREREVRRMRERRGTVECRVHAIERKR